MPSQNLQRGGAPGCIYVRLARSKGSQPQRRSPHFPQVFSEYATSLGELARTQRVSSALAWLEPQIPGGSGLARSGRSLPGELELTTRWAFSELNSTLKCNRVQGRKISQTLTEIEEAGTFVVDSVSDQDSALLKRLKAHGITPGALIEVTNTPREGFVIRVSTIAKALRLPRSLAGAVRIRSAR